MGWIFCPVADGVNKWWNIWYNSLLSEWHLYVFMCFLQVLCSIRSCCWVFSGKFLHALLFPAASLEHHVSLHLWRWLVIWLKYRYFVSLIHLEFFLTSLWKCLLMNMFCLSELTFFTETFPLVLAAFFPGLTSFYSFTSRRESKWLLIISEMVSKASSLHGPAGKHIRQSCHIPGVSSFGSAQ